MTRTTPELIRFLSKVSLSDGCWEWRGHRGQKNGYGYLWRLEDRTALLAHRIAYEHFVGPIPEGLHIDHLCRNRGCVNPAHLEAVSQGENNSRAMKETCKQGHPYTPENTLYERGGAERRCKTCRNRAQRAQYRARAALALREEAP